MTVTAPTAAPDAGPLSPQDGARATPSRGETAFNIAIWILFAALWVAFFAALLFSQGRLDDTWHRLRDLPLIVQGVIALLFLPITAGLWIWESSWPVLVRIVLIVSLGWFNLYLFFPWRRAS